MDITTIINALRIASYQQGLLACTNPNGETPTYWEAKSARQAEKFADRIYVTVKRQENEITALAIHYDIVQRMP